MTLPNTSADIIPARNVYASDAAYRRLITKIMGLDYQHPEIEAHIAEMLGEAGIWSDGVFADPERERLPDDPLPPAFVWTPPANGQG